MIQYNCSAIQIQCESHLKIDFVSNLAKDWKLHNRVLTRKHIQKDRLELRLHESAKSPEDNPFFLFTD